MSRDRTRVHPGQRRRLQQNKKYEAGFQSISTFQLFYFILLFQVDLIRFRYNAIRVHLHFIIFAPCISRSFRPGLIICYLCLLAPTIETRTHLVSASSLFLSIKTGLLLISLSVRVSLSRHGPSPSVDDIQTVSLPAYQGVEMLTVADDSFSGR